MTVTEQRYRIWFAAAAEYAAPALRRALDFFGSAEALFLQACAQPQWVAQQLGMRSRAHIDAFARRCSPAWFDDLFARIARSGASAVLWDTPEYPAALYDLPDAPAVLYLLGDETLLQKTPRIAMVGTRHCSPYGETTARSMAADLSAAGAVVISGMALGIDGWAHRGALQRGGRTVAVLGCGVDVCYPPAHEALYADIVQRGLVLSEYAPGTGPETWRFPRRNRIISGLAQGVVVVEAGNQSGSMITARQAQKQGRRLFAVPGNVDSARSSGSNQLIRGGAELVMTAGDVLAAFSMPPPAVQQRMVLPDGDQARLLDLLEAGELEFDTIFEYMQLPVHRLMQLLEDMTEQGLLRPVAGNRYSRG